MDRAVVAWTMFLVLTLGIINQCPAEFIQGSEYNPRQVSIPDEFSAWTLMPDHISLSKNLTKGSYTDYNFKDAYNVSIRVRVGFNRFYDGLIKLASCKPDAIFAGSFQVPFTPTLTKNQLASYWSTEFNASFVEFTNLVGKIHGHFYDQNSTRNDIVTAWEDGEINCTLTVPVEWEEDDDLGAREIIVALLSFNLDSVFRDIDPTLGFFMSATIFVPLMYVFFAFIMWGIHGE